MNMHVLFVQLRSVFFIFQKKELRSHMFAKKIDDLKLSDAGKIGYTLKAMGAGFWGLRQKDFRKALTVLTMEVSHSITPSIESWQGSNFNRDQYWRFKNYVTLYELQEFKDCKKPQNKHHKKRHKNRHALFHSQWKGITYSLFNNS